MSYQYFVLLLAVSDETATVAMKTAASVRDNMVKAEKAMVRRVFATACGGSHVRASLPASVLVCMSARLRACMRVSSFPPRLQRDTLSVLPTSSGGAGAFSHAAERAGGQRVGPI